VNEKNAHGWEKRRALKANVVTADWMGPSEGGGCKGGEPRLNPRPEKNDIRWAGFRVACEGFAMWQFPGENMEKVDEPMGVEEK